MKKLIITLALLMVFSTIVTAADITSCNTLINSTGMYESGTYIGTYASGMYALTSDLNCVDDDAGTNAIHVFNANDVTINCQGYNISADGLNGVILVQGSNNVTVKNCHTESHNTSSTLLSNNLFIAESQNVRLVNNDVLGQYEGITLRNVRNATVENNVVHSAIGISLMSMGVLWGALWNSTGDIIRNNVVDASTGYAGYGRYGLWVSGQYNANPAEPMVLNNLIEGNSFNASGGQPPGEDYSVLIWGGFDNSQQNNVFQSNNFSAPYTVFDKASTGNGGSGIDYNSWRGNNWNPAGTYYIDGANGTGTYAGDSSNIGYVSVLLLPIVSFVLNPDTVDLGTLALGEDKNTTTDSPLPFKLNNTGDVKIDISIASTNPLFTGTSPTYEFESSCIQSGCADSTIATWTSFNQSAQSILGIFEFANSKDSARLDVRVHVPDDEPAGTKSDMITFTAIQH